MSQCYTEDTFKELGVWIGKDPHIAEQISSVSLIKANLQISQEVLHSS